jgi:hypothetical protein
MDVEIPSDLTCRMTLDRHQTLASALISSVNIRRFTAILHLRSDHTELAEVSASLREDHCSTLIIHPTASWRET